MHELLAPIVHVVRTDLEAHTSAGAGGRLAEVLPPVFSFSFASSFSVPLAHFLTSASSF
jgi:hypothetical protein